MRACLVLHGPTADALPIQVSELRGRAVEAHCYTVIQLAVLIHEICKTDHSGGTRGQSGMVSGHPSRVEGKRHL